MTKFAPQQDWMLLEPCSYEQDTSNVITLDGYKEKAENISSFKVLVVGPDCGNVKVGDEVVTEGLSTPAFKYKGETHYVARAKDVVMVIN